MVALAFIPNNGLPQVRHVDGNKTNNSVSNLAWGNQSDNEKDKAAQGKSNIGERHGHAVLNNFQARIVRRCGELGMPTHDISDAFGITFGVTRSVIRKKTYAKVLHGEPVKVAA